MNPKTKVWRLTWTDKAGDRQEKEVTATADNLAYTTRRIKLNGGKNLRIEEAK